MKVTIQKVINDDLKDLYIILNLSPIDKTKNLF